MRTPQGGFRGHHFARKWRHAGRLTLETPRKRDAAGSSTCRADGRREFLWQLGGGIGGVALASLLGRDGLLAADGTSGKLMADGGLHRPARAKRVVQFFVSGAASQCDLFDYKPLLIQKNGEPWDPGEKVELFQSSPGHCFASPWGTATISTRRSSISWGIDHERLTFRHNGIDRRLTDVHGHVVREILASARTFRALATRPANRVDTGGRLF